MSASMLPKCHVAVDQRRLGRRKLRSAHVLFAEKFVDGAGSSGSQEHALGIHPTIALRSAAADEDRPRRAQRNQLVRIHRKIVPCEWTGVLEEVAGHRVILARSSHVL